MMEASCLAPSEDIICNFQRESWFGGFFSRIYDDISVRKEVKTAGFDFCYSVFYELEGSFLSEHYRLKDDRSVLIQDKVLIEDLPGQIYLLEALLNKTTYRFLSRRFFLARLQAEKKGRDLTAELTGPAAMLQFYLGSAGAEWLLEKQPERAEKLMRIHMKTQKSLLKEMIIHKVPAVTLGRCIEALTLKYPCIISCCESFKTETQEICRNSNTSFL